MTNESLPEINIDLTNDLPYQLVNVNGTLKCKWLNAAGKRFTEPFFRETISACRIRDIDNGQRHNRITPLADMVKAAGRLAPAKPAVIIFHTSRCGSTLLTQSFASSEKFNVLSEVPFFDEILRHPLCDADFSGRDDPAALFEASLRFYGRKRHPAEENTIIKTDCWHIFFYDLFRRLFPDVPFILMYRNPAEVLRSHLKLPGQQTVPDLVAPEIFGLPGVPEVYQRDIYTASILEKLLEKFILVARTNPNAVLVNYNEGPVAAIRKVASAAGFAIDEETFSKMLARTQFHSKDPSKSFLKEAGADTPACIANAMQLYERLDTLRIKKAHA